MIAVMMLSIGIPLNCMKQHVSTAMYGLVFRKLTARFFFHIILIYFVFSELSTHRMFMAETFYDF